MLVSLPLITCFASVGDRPGGETLAEWFKAGEQAYASGDYQGARAHWDAALERAREQKDIAAIARLQVRLSRVDEATGHFERAILRAEEAGDLARKIGDDALVATALDIQALAERRLARYDAAVSTAQQAVEIARRLGDARLQASSLRNIGAAAEAVGDYARAAARYQTSLEAANASGDALEQAMTLNNLGGLSRKRGEYEQALDYYGGSLAKRREGGDRGGEGRVLGNICLAYFNLGDYRQALEHCERSLAIARKLGDSVREANNLNNIAAIYREQGECPKALSYYQQSLEIKRRTGDRAGQGRTLSNMGDCNWLLGEDATAIAHFEEARNISEEIGDRPAESAIELNLGILRLNRGQHRAALDHLKNALVLQAGVDRPEVLWRVYDGLSRTQTALGHTNGAILFGKLAVNTIQGMRAISSGLERALQQSFLRDKVSVYRDLSRLLIDEGRLAEAEQVLAMLKEEEFFEFIQRDAAADAKQSSAPMSSPEREADDQIESGRRSVIEVATEMAKLQSIRRGDRTDAQRARFDDLRRALRDADERYAATLERILANFAAITDIARREELTEKRLGDDLQWVVAKLSEQSGRNVALIYYLVSPERLDILVTLPAVRQAHRIVVSKAELNREIEALRAALRDPRSEPAATARVLYERLFAPIAAELQKAGVQVLMLYLDDALRYLPFAALYDGAHYLVEEYALSVYTAAAANAVMTRPKPDWEVAGLGLSRAQPGFEPLKAVSQELEGIVRHGADDPDGVLPGVVQLDDAFTEEALRARFAEGFEVVHVASHFVFTPGNYRDSFLLLGDGTRVNLHTLDAYRLSGIELLTLSACDTAVGGGKDAQGREVEGLATLTLRRGAKGVLATLWTVADRSTALFMQKLYSLHSDGDLSKAEALRQTQLAFIDGSVKASSGARRGEVLNVSDSDREAGRPASMGYRHPYYWAPFILMGNWQ